MPSLKRKIIPMPTSKWSKEILSANQLITDGVTSVIINIGLILQTVGKEEDGIISFTIEKDHLRLARKQNEFFVYKLDAVEDTQSTLFHADVTPKSFISKSFMRGKWEQTLSDWTEKVREVVSGKKEEGSTK